MNKNYQAIILAGGKGSRLEYKGPKALFEINNIPLIEYTLQAVSKSLIKKNTFILTDSTKIKNIAKKYSINTSYIRPKHTSNDKSSTICTLRHFSDWILKKNDYDAIILLQPTSPLRNSYDINKSINIFKKKNIRVYLVSQIIQSIHMMRLILKKNLSQNLFLKKELNFQEDKTLILILILKMVLILFLVKN